MTGAVLAAAGATPAGGTVELQVGLVFLGGLFLLVGGFMAGLFYETGRQAWLRFMEWLRVAVIYALAAAGLVALVVVWIRSS